MARRRPAASDTPPARALAGVSVCDLSDALDRLGIAGAVLGILPLWPGCRGIVGRAVTLKLIPEGPGSPVEGTLRAIGAAGRGEVLVIDHGGRAGVNSFGGIAAYSAARRGLAGVVIDGQSRDVDEMKAMRFPIFGRGVVQQSVRGRCAFGGTGIEVSLGGVAVRPGDLVAADDNGVVVVPAARIGEALEIARAVVARERKIKGWIARGVDPLEAHRRASYEARAEKGAGPAPGRRK